MTPLQFLWLVPARELQRQQIANGTVGRPQSAGPRQVASFATADQGPRNGDSCSMDGTLEKSGELRVGGFAPTGRPTDRILVLFIAIEREGVHS
jgi:hypothetical protein